jgi:hypothetical protein
MMVWIRTGTCELCGEDSSVQVPDEIKYKVQAYLLDRSAFGFIQDEFPMLSASQRELMITGTHDECWQRIFADDE